MRQKRDPIPRAKEAWVWLAGTLLLGILGAGVVGAAVLLWEHVDIRQLTPALATPPAELPEPLPAAAAAVDGAPFTAVLFDSDRNRAYFAEEEYHAEELAGWRELIGAVGGEVREAADAAELSELTPDQLLVLAESPCLTAAELGQIRRHRAAGGSVVASWAVGVRNGACDWRGWAPLLELTRAEEVQELPTRDGLFLTVPAGIALSAGFDPGTRIELRPDPSLALRISGPRVYWSDWALNPAPDEGGLGADVAAFAARFETGGRVAWLGPRLGQAATPRDSLHLRRLAQNGVLWAAGRASASVAAWPGAARAAMVFSLDVEDQARNAVEVATLFEREGLPGTFFAVTRIVGEDDELAATLGRAGEVGSQTVDHTPLAGLTAQDQSVRLRRSWLDIERWTGSGPAGLRPPEEAFDEATLRGWAQAGGTYVLARNEARTASPELHDTPAGTVVVLPRLLKDDYNIVVQDRTIRNRRVGESFLVGARKLRAIGGLAVVAGHTQIMQSAPRIDAFRVVADAVRSEGDWWLARGDEVATWWAARARVQLDFVPAEPLPTGRSRAPSGISDLIVLTSGDGSTHDVWIDVVLPRGSGSLVPLVDGESVGFEATEWGIRVPVDVLVPGEARRISFALAGPEETPAGG